MFKLRKTSEAQRGLAKQTEASPFRRELDEAMRRAWEAVGQPWMTPIVAPWPPIDLAEDEKTVTLSVDLPGLDPKDVEVELSGNQLTIRGRREEEHKEGNGGALRHERYVGRFSRTVTLPSYADPARVEARFDKGVLLVSVPKAPDKAPKRVEVKGA